MKTEPKQMYATKPKKKRSAYLNTARAYYRIARKFDKAGNRHLGDHYRNVADGFVKRHNDNKAKMAVWMAKA